MSDAQDLFAIDAEARRLQRHNDAAKVRAAGCVCHALEWGTDDFQGVLKWVSEDRQELESHDPRCPEALADLILEGGE